MRLHSPIPGILSQNLDIPSLLTTNCYRPEVLQYSFQYNPIVQGVDHMEFRPKRFAKENQHILRGLTSNRGTPKVTEDLRLFGTIQTTVLFSHPLRIHIIATINRDIAISYLYTKRVRYHNTVTCEDAYIYPK